MYQKVLNKFFQENTLTSEMPTAPALAHFYLMPYAQSMALAPLGFKADEECVP